MASIDLLAPGSRPSRRAAWRGRWAGWAALGLVLATAARPLSLVVHEHGAGDRVHVHVHAAAAPPPAATAHRGEHRHHHHSHDHHGHHAHDHQVATAAPAHHHHHHHHDDGDHRAAPPPAAVAGAAHTLRAAHGFHRLHWHGDHLLALAVLRLAWLSAALPLIQSTAGAAADPVASRPRAASRARGPPALRSTPTFAVS